MKKVILGIVSIFFAGQVSFAQPVSDMAVIPMGITVQSIMRLDITRGGNVEFVFSRIEQLTNGILFGEGFQTEGTISASQNFDLILETDGPFTDEAANTLAIDVVEFDVTTVPAGGTPAVSGVLVSPTTLIDAATLGSNLAFVVDWQCGVTNSVSGAVAGRYTANIILTLAAD